MTATTATPPPAVIDVPLTPAQITRRLDGDGYLTADVAIDLDDLIGRDLDVVLDLLTAKAVGTHLLADITYTAVGATPDGLVIVRVTGDPRDSLGYDDTDER